MNRRGFLVRAGLTALGLAGLESPASAGAAAARAPANGAAPPNFIIFLIDDMGWTDSALYGSTFYETPALQRLAAEGMRFTDAHAAAPLCSATRASLMSGQYPGRLRLTSAIVLPPGGTEITDPAVPDTDANWARVCTPPIRTHLPLEQYTIAEALRDAGYTTCHIGKWHLGNEPWWPEHQGFDINIGGGYWWNPPSYFSPYHITTLPDGPEGEYITDRLTTEAENYLETHKDGPFFLNFCHYAVHSPWQAKPDLIAKYESKLDPQKAHRNPTYAAMIESMDQSLGRILDKLDALGIAGNTLILFMSDNGGVTQTGAGNTRYIGSNAPLRLCKATLYEGGTREPMVARWPGVIAPGSVCDVPVSTIDFYPTLLEATGVAPNPSQTLDGISLMPLLAGAGALAREALFYHLPHYVFDARPPGLRTPDRFATTPVSAAIKDGWKLLRFYGEGPTTREDRYELHHLPEDLGEVKDLSAARPDKVDELRALLDAHLAATGALIPRPNPAYYGPAVYLGWRAQNACNASAADGVLRLEATGGDPSFFGPTFSHAETPRVYMRLRTTSLYNTGQLYWATTAAPNFDGARRFDFMIYNDGQWYDYVFDIPLSAGETLAQLRFDPGGNVGVVEARWIKLATPGPSGPIMLEDWDFSKIAQFVNGWVIPKSCSANREAGCLRVEIAGGDPGLDSPPIMRFGPLLARLRVRTEGAGKGRLLWAEESTGYSFSAARQVELDLVHDGRWHEYETPLPVSSDAKLIQLRFVPGTGPGVVEIDWIRLFQPSDLGPALLDTWDFGVEPPPVDAGVRVWNAY
ncbi:MAG: sulfatase [bacterium]|nr:sulfatase [bacterium]